MLSTEASQTWQKLACFPGRRSAALAAEMSNLAKQMANPKVAPDEHPMIDAASGTTALCGTCSAGEAALPAPARTAPPLRRQLPLQFWQSDEQPGEAAGQLQCEVGPMIAKMMAKVNGSR